MNRGLYVYAFVDAALRPSSIAGHRIEVIQVGGLHVAIERVIDRPPLSEDALATQHEIVIRLGCRTRSILPARFGAFVPQDELTRLVDLRRGELLRSLEHTRDRAQMTVRLLTRIRRPDLIRQLGRTSSGTEYLRLRSAAAAAPHPAAARIFCDALAGLVVDERMESRSSPPLTTIMHLVPRGKAAVYRRIARRAAAALGPSFTVSIGGPLPPFGFVPAIWP